MRYIFEKDFAPATSLWLIWVWNDKAASSKVFCIFQSSFRKKKSPWGFQSDFKKMLSIFGYSPIQERLKQKPFWDIDANLLKKRARYELTWLYSPHQMTAIWYKRKRHNSLVYPPKIMEGSNCPAQFALNRRGYLSWYTRSGSYILPNKLVTFFLMKPLYSS